VTKKVPDCRGKATNRLRCIPGASTGNQMIAAGCQLQRTREHVPKQTVYFGARSPCGVRCLLAYTRASGFNLVTSMRRGNRHLVGVVMGGRSGGSRDAIMRGLLAENLEKASTRRTVAAITERNPSDANADVAEAEAESQPAPTVQVQGAVQAAPVEPAAPPPVRSAASVSRAIVSAATAAMPPQAKSDISFEAKSEAKSEPAPLSSGVIQTQPIAAIPGSSEPMKPVKVKTVQIKAGQVKLASAGSAQPATPATSAIPARPEVPETSSAVMAKAETSKPDSSKVDMPPQPANHGTGNGLLGVLPASSVPSAAPSQALAYADPALPVPNRSRRPFSKTAPSNPK
jgi:D-alanyl-D-alanine carboxypeptidase